MDLNKFSDESNLFSSVTDEDFDVLKGRDKFISSNNLEYQIGDDCDGEKVYRGFLLYANDYRNFSLKKAMINDIIVYTVLGVNCKFITTKYGMSTEDYNKIIRDKKFVLLYLLNVSNFNRWLYSYNERAYSSQLRMYARSIGFIEDGK